MVNFLDTASLKNIVAAQSNGTVVIPLDGLNKQSQLISGIPTLSSRTELISKNITQQKINVPVAPSGHVSDETIFTDLGQKSITYYLPRYRLSTEVVGGEQRYRLSLRPAQSGWELVVYLDAYPAPAIERHVRDARRLSAELSVKLTYQWHREQGELEFQEVLAEDGGDRLKAVLWLNTLEERDEVYLALTDSSYNAALVVQRQVKVAIPRTQRASARLSPINTFPIRRLPPNFLTVLRPQLILKKIENYTVRGNAFTRYRLEVTNWSSFSNDLFAPSPNLPPCGLNKNSSRTWVNIHAKGGRRLYGFCAFSKAENLKSLWFSVPQGQTPPPEVYIVLNDRLKNQTYTSNSISTKPVPDSAKQFDVVQKRLDHVVDDTFFFPPSLYPYIFKSTQPIPPDQNNLIMREVVWKTAGDSIGKTYRYYQNASERYRFNYTPDAFAIGRDPETDRPTLSLRFVSSDGSLEEDKMQAELRYYAAPVISSDRLEAASTSLKVHAPDPLPPGIEGLEFLPLRVGKLKFYISLPNADRATDLTWEQEAQVSLQDGIFDKITLPLDRFWEVWGAIFSSRRENTLFTGRVEVSVMDNVPPDVIPFSIRSDSDPQTLLENILEPDTAKQFIQPVTVNVASALFSSADASKSPIDKILVSFERGDRTLTFTSSVLKQTINVRMPIRDPQKLLENVFGEYQYRYKVQVIRLDGDVTDLPAIANEWLTDSRSEFYLDINR